MAVRIRLARHGRLHRPFFRIVAIDGRRHREGEANEILGTYDPLAEAKNLQVDMDRVQAWLARGALVSEALGKLMKHYGYALPAAKPRAKSPAPKKDGKTWVPATRRAVRKHALRVKKERLAKAAAEKPAEAAPAEAPKA